MPTRQGATNVELPPSKLHFRRDKPARHGWRTPKPSGIIEAVGNREASWSAVVLYRLTALKAFASSTACPNRLSPHLLPKRQRTGAVQNLTELLRRWVIAKRRGGRRLFVSPPSLP